MDWQIVCCKFVFAQLERLSTSPMMTSSPKELGSLARRALTMRQIVRSVHRFVWASWRNACVGYDVVPMSSLLACGWPYESVQASIPVLGASFKLSVAMCLAIRCTSGSLAHWLDFVPLAFDVVTHLKDCRPFAQNFNNSIKFWLSQLAPKPQVREKTTLHVCADNYTLKNFLHFCARECAQSRCSSSASCATCARAYVWHHALYGRVCCK